MPTPTPKQVKHHILVSMGRLSNHLAGVDVDNKEVVAAVLASLGYEPDDIVKARNNINFAATQILRPGGLLMPKSKRGMWALTAEGVAQASKTEWASAPSAPVAPVAPVAPAAPVAPVAPAAPVAPVAPVPSPWADDSAGVPVYHSILPDTYCDDAYIRTIGVSKSRCFGGFRQSEPICASCPVAGSCQTHQLMAFSEASAALSRTSTTPTPSKKHTAAHDLKDIMDDLEGAAASPAPARKSLEITAMVDSICYICHGLLPEGSTVLYTPNRGMSHLNSCK
jgi:hypothetical protein